MAMTMLQMAGAAPTPATTADGVLLIIDAQREYTDGLMPLTGVAAAVEALAVLLEKARKAGAPVVHVRHQSKGKAFNPSSTGYEIVASLTPRAGETIVDKALPNAFAGTELEFTLFEESYDNAWDRRYHGLTGYGAEAAMVTRLARIEELLGRSDD